MAAAYGVEPVVAALLDAGADARCRNSLSWTPLHEACHRGFEPIVRRLLAAPGAAADLGHVPDGDAARRFPFARPPPQSCLGEAARCGFKDIAVLLLEAGAPPCGMALSGKTSNLSISVKSKSFRLIFGRVDFSR